MASQLVTSRGGGGSVLVSRAPVELAAVGLDGLPLHGVLGGDGANFILVVDDVGLSLIIAHGESSTEVLLASGLHGSVEASGLSCLDITGCM
jgi:hypothetical protein